MRKSKLFLVFLIFLFSVSCEKETRNLYSVHGNVQKGPYINGTSITISELSSTLVPTGKTFNTQIIDNKGSFKLSDIEFSSQFVELKADGFYFDEVDNESSSAQLTLYALSDLTDRSILNVNILSSLEKARVEYLISNGNPFDEAKSQSQKEILKIFEVESTDLPVSEVMDISSEGEGNAILLAISVILQGYLSVAELSEFLANISTDIKEDGVLNSDILGEKLINNARLIKAEEIIKNLEERYASMGLTITVPSFEFYLEQFIENTSYHFTAFIEYPASGKYGLNILNKDKTDYEAGHCSMKAILPEGTFLKVKISGQNWGFPSFQDNTGWEFSDWDNIDNSRIFTSNKTGEIDFDIILDSSEDSTRSNKTIIYVFENEDIEPAWLKEIIIE